MFVIKISHFQEFGIGFIDHNQEGYFDISIYNKVSHLYFTYFHAATYKMLTMDKEYKIVSFMIRIVNYILM